MQTLAKFDNYAYCAHMPSFTRPLSVAEASEQSGEPRRTVRYAITAGQLKAQKMPGATGAWLIQSSDLDRWIAKRQAKASA